MQQIYVLCFFDGYTFFIERFKMKWQYAILKLLAI